MDLISAKVEAAKVSKEKSNKQFVNVDGEGECSVGKFDPKASTVCYSSGSQIPMPTNEPEEEKVKIKKEKKVKKVKKVAKKKVAKKATAPRKAIEGKKMKITVKKALELAKKGSQIFRASNGSPFGKYYLDKIQNKEKEMELIVR